MNDIDMVDVETTETHYCWFYMKNSIDLIEIDKSGIDSLRIK